MLKRHTYDRKKNELLSYFRQIIMSKMQVKSYSVKWYFVIKSL